METRDQAYRPLAQTVARSRRWWRSFFATLGVLVLGPSLFSRLTSRAASLVGRERNVPLRSQPMARAETNDAAGDFALSKDAAAHGGDARAVDEDRERVPIAPGSAPATPRSRLGRVRGRAGALAAGIVACGAVLVVGVLTGVPQYEALWVELLGTNGSVNTASDFPAQQQPLSGCDETPASGATSDFGLTAAQRGGPLRGGQPGGGGPGTPPGQQHATRTPTRSPAWAFTPENTSTPTGTPVPADTETPTETPWPTKTPVPDYISTATEAPTASDTPTPTDMPTVTPEPGAIAPPAPDDLWSALPTYTETPELSVPAAPVATATQQESKTATPTATAGCSAG